MFTDRWNSWAIVSERWQISQSASDSILGFGLRECYLVHRFAEITSFTHYGHPTAIQLVYTRHIIFEMAVEGHKFAIFILTIDIKIVVVG